jgi:hypothetical protein
LKSARTSPGVGDPFGYISDQERLVLAIDGLATECKRDVVVCFQRGSHFLQTTGATSVDIQLAGILGE